MDRQRLAIGITFLALTGVVVGVRVYRKRPTPFAMVPAASSSQDDPHGHGPAGVDFANAPVAAMFAAPEGSTPCATAYNAAKAFHDVEKAHGKGPPTFPSASAFEGWCTTLPPMVQRCMQPKYELAHRAECGEPLRKLEGENNPLK